MESDSSSSESSDDYYGMHAVVNSSNIKVVSANIKVKLQDKKISFQIDTGASVNVISEKVFKTLDNINLKKSNVKLYAYGATSKLKVLGCFETAVEINKKYDVATFYVVRGDVSNSLLGLETALQFGVVKIINIVVPVSEI